MNISQAKREIANTLRAYHRRDESGRYVFPGIRQRPILLMGPPGIGKTAILAQIAAEEGVGLVAYTMTHHTRQSAIGLPHIEARTGPDGAPVSVTSYTLSEIIASVYDCMARTGKREGILFVDEINCVSETLAPMMLQFLQNKTFGSHRVPEGWMIVAAGNPPAYNRSVRDFDVVTLDRVRQIDVEPDLSVWMDYARQQQVHGAVLSYLGVREDQFYRIERTPAGTSFVTARSWEDLSALMRGYEDLGIEVGEDQIKQYLRDGDIARGFAGYYRLYRKYAGTYDIPGILSGQDSSVQADLAAAASMEERLAVVDLLLDGLGGQLARYEREDRSAVRLHEVLGQFRLFMKDQPDAGCLEDFAAARRDALRVKLQAGLLEAGEQETEERVLSRLDAYVIALKGAHIQDKEAGFTEIRRLFAGDLRTRAELVETIRGQLDAAFAFLEKCYGDGQEMILFVSSLTHTERAMAFISLHGCPAYLRHSEALLCREREQDLRDACAELLDGRTL